MLEATIHHVLLLAMKLTISPTKLRNGVLVVGGDMQSIVYHSCHTFFIHFYIQPINCNNGRQILDDVTTDGGHLSILCANTM